MLAIGTSSEVAGYPIGALLGIGVWGALLTFALVSFLTRRADRPAEVTSWARSHGVRLTARTRPLVRYYVSLAITCRGIGAVGAMYLGYVVDRAFGVDTSSGAGWWTWVIGGWAVGALWAQHQVAPSPAAPATASLTPRRLADYLPVGLRWAPAGALGLMAGSTIAMRALTHAEAPDTFPLPSWTSLGGRVLAAALVAAAVALAEQRIVGRRQAVLEPDLLAADDAVRTSAIHQVAGAGTAMICTLGLANHAAVIEVPWIDVPGAFSVLPITFLVLALFSWRSFAYRAWRVRRSDLADRPPDPVPT